MVASNPNQLLERAEGTAKSATQRIGLNNSPETALGAMTDAVRAMWHAMNAVLVAVGVSPEDDRIMSRISDDIVAKGVLSEETFRLLLDAQSVKSRAVYGAGEADAAKAMRLLGSANEFIAVTRKAVERAALHEYDVVRLRRDVWSDGYAAKKGMTGTIVSIYSDGEAFAIEIPDLGDGPAVLTLRTDDLERIWEAEHG